MTSMTGGKNNESIATATDDDGNDIRVIELRCRRSCIKMLHGISNFSRKVKGSQLRVTK